MERGGELHQMLMTTGRAGTQGHADLGPNQPFRGEKGRLCLRMGHRLRRFLGELPRQDRMQQSTEGCRSSRKGSES